jgi:carbonic anhydrase
VSSEPPEPDSGPHRALVELLAGNDRFVTGGVVHPNQDAQRRAAVADTQTPFAVIFGCSDSRLAAEIIFDRGLGDLFVVRTAGHTIGAEVLGSIEYAVSVLSTPLVVVLGHSGCGAVAATQQALSAGSPPSGHVRALVEAVAPSVRLAAGRGIGHTDGVVDVHIEHTVADLLERSAILAGAVRAGRCAVVGMSYQLAEGRVRVLPAG